MDGGGGVAETYSGYRSVNVTVNAILNLNAVVNGDVNGDMSVGRVETGSREG